jgi:hypothetical protein
VELSVRVACRNNDPPGDLVARRPGGEKSDSGAR